MRLFATAVHVLVLLVSSCMACTVWQMSGGGFAAGLNSLYLAYPVFFGTNGTFYIDAREMRYSCSTGMEGWQKGLYDFFQLNDVHRWTPSLESDLGDICARLDDSSINDILREVELPYSELQAQAALQVRSSVSVSVRLCLLCLRVKTCSELPAYGFSHPALLRR